VAENLVLEAQPRELVGKKVSRLRRAGLVPAIIYGPKSEPVTVQIPYRPLQLALLKAGGTHLIDLQIGSKKHTVLAREVQRDIMRGDITHVDFFAVDLKAKIAIDVPVHFINESPAVASKKGVLLTGPTMLSIETLPTHMPESIEVDLSGLVEVGDSIHVRDLKIDADMTILNDPDEMVARINQSSAARSEEAEELEAAATPAEVEIIKKGKADEEEVD
jgi:large subunit ribosomal protein L25